MVVLCGLSVLSDAQGGWVCSFEPQWSDLLMSQHFSPTDPPQDGVECSTFTYQPAAILVLRLHLSPGLERLLVFVPGPAFSCLFESLLCVNGALDKLLLSVFMGMHHTKLPRQAFRHSQLSHLLSFVISTVTMWAPGNCCHAVEALAF
ncbi:hypothetical protein HPG69_012077 [Diceros bicornis minor]|uniref:Uncharacterized protein n=1 Tax=Diceros bicornis minor TaxID=77932 RepID=A0A7J7EXR6_DICBM|nr:hypothetical protein HPG69_012077 [Diceros bicornis minor]